ncbi:MAG: FCD domain-containing protein [Nitriliruptorales bacterium]|nr:FCD domain-containing protein [Nitriliruptorales bacterium]
MSTPIQPWYTFEDVSYTSSLIGAAAPDASVDGRIVTELRDAILAGDLVAGTRLNQADLATQLGVSRIPVRDALQRLAAEGLVEIRGRAGTFVSALSVADLQELYELREAVEPLAARLGLPNVGRAQFLRMEQLHRQLAEEQDPRAWMRANAAFHAQLHASAGRPRMIALVEHLRRLTDRYLHLHLSVIGGLERLQDEHAQILDAARRRDPAAVAECTHVHLATSHEFVLSYLLEHDLEIPPAELKETP